MKKQKLLYWLFTGLLCAWMTYQAVTFIINLEFTQDYFESLYVSPLLVIPLATAKLLAVIAILTDQSKVLKALAYGGLAADFLSALFVHIRAADGMFPAPIIALALLFGSFYYYLPFLAARARR